MLDVVARPVPTPQAGTNGSRAKHALDQRHTHEDTDLAVVDLPPVAAPWPFDAHRVRTAFGETAGIKRDDAIRLAQAIGHLTHQHLDQRLVVPGRGANEGLHDLALDIDERRDVLSILARQVGQQPLEVEMHVALAGLRLQSVLIGHDELTQTVHHLLDALIGFQGRGIEDRVN